MWSPSIAKLFSNCLPKPSNTVYDELCKCPDNTLSVVLDLRWEILNDDEVRARPMHVYKDSRVVGFSNLACNDFYRSRCALGNVGQQWRWETNYAGYVGFRRSHNARCIYHMTPRNMERFAYQYIIVLKVSTGYLLGCLTIVGRSYILQLNFFAIQTAISQSANRCPAKNISVVRS